MKQTYVVGDVHGCFYTLMALVGNLPKDADLVFVGDLCDKGLYTKKVIDFVKNNGFRSVLGNHDFHMIKYLKSALNGEKFKWNTSGEYAGDATVANYRDCDEKIVDEHIEWISSLPTYVEIGQYFITHGFGLPYYVRKDAKRSKLPLRTNRISSTRHINDWEAGWEEYEVVNIFGHDSFDDVAIGKNYYGIDTGCKYSNKLTAIELGSMQIIQEKTNAKDIRIL